MMIPHACSAAVYRATLDRLAHLPNLAGLSKLQTTERKREAPNVLSSNGNARKRQVGHFILMALTKKPTPDRKLAIAQMNSLSECILAMEIYLCRVKNHSRRFQE